MGWEWEGERGGREGGIEGKGVVNEDHFAYPKSLHNYLRVRFIESIFVCLKLSAPGSESRLRKALQWIKSKFVLPWWFVFVAWFLVFVFSVGSGVVLILYGMRFGNAKSLQWLLSATISFIQDVLITQPLKVRDDLFNTHCYLQELHNRYIFSSM